MHQFVHIEVCKVYVLFITAKFICIGLMLSKYTHGKGNYKHADEIKIVLLKK